MGDIKIVIRDVTPSNLVGVCCCTAGTSCLYGSSVFLRNVGIHLQN